MLSNSGAMLSCSLSSVITNDSCILIDVGDGMFLFFNG